MSPEERAYYRSRAADERARAAGATSVAAEIHLRLACFYDKVVELDEAPQGHLRIVDLIGSRRVSSL